MSLARRWIFRTIVTAGVALLVEGGAHVFFHVFRDRFTFAAPEQYTLTPERVERLRNRFDGELGWVSHYATPYGERPHTRARRRTLMATFGDSHTHGDEVGDSETWQESLSELVDADVLNFGVSGYGVDQALLRSRRVTPSLKPPIAGLGFVFENINRVVNRYRPFYFRATGIPLPKPRFVLRDGRLQLLPNPITRAEDLDRLSDPMFIARLGQDDFYYTHAGLPYLGFPYARLLISPSIWNQALGRARRTASDVDGLPAVNLWRDDEARGIFMGILDAFVADTRASGVRPMILILPGRADVDALRAGRPFPGYQRVLKHCAERGYDCFDGIAPFGGEAREVPLDECFQSGGHSSARGNAIIAAALARHLRAQDLLGALGAHAREPSPSARAIGLVSVSS